MGLNIFDELVSEWAYRSKTGAPSIKNQEDLFLLEDILLEMGIEPNMVIENIRLLSEEPEDEKPKDSDDENWKKGYTHKNWGFYVKNSDVGKEDAQIYKADSDKGKMLPVSQDEYEKVKKERGDGKDSQAKDAKGQGEKTDDTQAPPAGKLTSTDFNNADRASEEDEEDKAESKRAAEKQKSEEDKIESVSSGETIETRVTNPEVKKELQLDNQESLLEAEELSGLIPYMSELPEEAQNDLGTTILRAMAYSGRPNSGADKNSLGFRDVQTLNANRENLLDLYGDGSPKEVERLVRHARQIEISDEFLEKSFKMLPKNLQTSLKSKGKVGDYASSEHFLGYERNDGSTATDVNDPDIKVDENGNKVVKRGKLPSKDRALVAWRMYLEQGGRCAYSGQAVGIEDMDLEHVVGMQNSDNGSPTLTEYKQREHEANQVLCKSSMNQLKAEKNMSDFFSSSVDPLKDKSEEAFGGKEKATEIKTDAEKRDEETALLYMDNPRYVLNNGETTTDVNHPDIKKSERGVPEVSDANMSDELDSDTLREVFSKNEEGVDKINSSIVEMSKSSGMKISAHKSKLGAKFISVLGLTRYVQKPGGRGSQKMYTSDNHYRTFLLSMADLPAEKRADAKEKWAGAVSIANSDEVRKANVQKKVSFAYLLREGVIGSKHLAESGSPLPIKKKDLIKKQDGTYSFKYKDQILSATELGEALMNEYNSSLGTDF